MRLERGGRRRIAAPAFLLSEGVLRHLETGGQNERGFSSSRFNSSHQEGRWSFASLARNL